MALSAFIGMGIGLLGSGYQALKGAKEARDAKEALANYQRQKLKNYYEDLTVSTLGSDLQREEQAGLASSQLETLQGAGVRGLIGGLGRVELGSQTVNKQIGAGLDEQQKAIDQMSAQGASQNQLIQEEREKADIAALSSQYNAGQSGLMQGIGSMANIGMNAFMRGELEGEGKADKRPKNLVSNAMSNRPASAYGLGLNNKPLFTYSGLAPYPKS